MIRLPSPVFFAVIFPVFFPTDKTLLFSLLFLFQGFFSVFSFCFFYIGFFSLYQTFSGNATEVSITFCGYFHNFFAKLCRKELNFRRE